jgi:hypothetical protein
VRYKLTLYESRFHLWGAPRDVKNDFAVFRIRKFRQTVVFGVKSL